MKINREIKKKGIIFYYLIAIVVPCFLLGILAFRGIKNDQALVEREQRRTLMEIKQDIFQDLDDYLSKIENSFLDLVVTGTLSRGDIFNNSTPTQFSTQHDVVEGIFFLENRNRLSVCDNGLLYFPDGYIPESEIILLSSSLKKGWQYEFRTKDFDKAFQYYYTLLKNTKNNKRRGELLNAMARVKKKQGKFESALAIYDSIQSSYSRIVIQNKIPLGIVAFLEKNNCYLQLKDTASALENLVMFQRMLLNRNWELEESYYFDYQEKADETISLCRNSKNNNINFLNERVEALKDSLANAETKTQYLLAFLKNRESIVESLRTKDNTAKQRYKYEINGLQYFYALLSGNENNEWGILFNTNKILENVLIPLMQEQASTFQFYWEIENEDGEWLAGSGEIPDELFPLNSDFPSNLPSWSLTFYPENRGLLATFFRSGGGFFFYIFIVVLVILVFGLIFTLQTVNNKIELSKMKSSFVSTVSHELKSPLTSIRQIAEILVYKKVSSERKEKYFNMILQQSERLSHLIENILDFSKIEAGQKQFHFENTDLAVLAEKVIQSFQDRMATRNFQINLFIANSINKIHGDKEALEQVLYNLIDNAIKYSGKADKVEIDVESVSEFVVVRVRDYGIGIQKEEQEKIFNQFYRVGEELTQTVKGTGIGLTIVKQIVEAHKGKITVESKIGKGSTFILKFKVISDEKDTDNRR